MSYFFGYTHAISITQIVVHFMALSTLMYERMMKLTAPSSYTQYAMLDLLHSSDTMLALSSVPPEQNGLPLQSSALE